MSDINNEYCKKLAIEFSISYYENHDDLSKNYIGFFDFLKDSKRNIFIDVAPENKNPFVVNNLDTGEKKRFESFLDSFNYSVLKYG